jgi:hypothetical protein
MGDLQVMRASMDSDPDQVERHVRSLRQEAGSQGERSAQAVKVFTEKQPLVALIIAVGIGSVGARVLRR